MQTSKFSEENRKQTTKTDKYSPPHLNNKYVTNIDEDHQTIVKSPSVHQDNHAINTKQPQHLNKKYIPHRDMTNNHNAQPAQTSSEHGQQSQVRRVRNTPGMEGLNTGTLTGTPAQHRACAGTTVTDRY